MVPSGQIEDRLLMRHPWRILSHAEAKMAPRSRQNVAVSQDTLATMPGMTRQTLALEYNLCTSCTKLVTHTAL